MTQVIFQWLVFLGWAFCGYVSFVYWWTKSHDYTADKIWLAVIAAVIGPITFIIGALIYGESVVLMRKRK